MLQAFCIFARFVHRLKFPIITIELRTLSGSPSFPRILLRRVRLKPGRQSDLCALSHNEVTQNILDFLNPRMVRRGPEPHLDPPIGSERKSRGTSKIQAPRAGQSPRPCEQTPCPCLILMLSSRTPSN